MNESRMLKDHNKCIVMDLSFICPDNLSFEESEEILKTLFESVKLPKGFSWRHAHVGKGWVKKEL